MHIVIDATVSLASELFGPLGELTVVPPREITRQLLMKSDALVVRSTVQVGRDLLDGTAVRFVGTATSGTDHVDEAWLEKAGIAFAAAAGCNAQAVAEYVVAALLEMSERRRWEPAGRTLGIVGVGHVGSRVARLGGALGMQILACDPPLARAGGGSERFVGLGELLTGSDVVTLHVPLTDTGPDATRRLLSENMISMIRNGAILINTARGAVLDTQAAIAARRAGRLSGVVLDVWEGEPDVDRAILEEADIMTPHIAGHSVEGKIAGTRMISDAMARWMSRKVAPRAAGEAGDKIRIASGGVSDGRGNDRAAGLDVLRDVVRRVCDLAGVDSALRQIALGRNTGGRGAADVARREYPLRREFASYVVDVGEQRHRENPEIADMLGELGFDVEFGKHNPS